LTCDELIRSLPILKNSSSSDDYLSGRNNTGVLSEYVTASDDDNDSKFELQNLISTQRLAKKLIKLEQHNQEQLTIAVIGGSMTTGWVDGSEFNNNTYNLAFPRKLEQFMKQRGQQVPLE